MSEDKEFKASGTELDWLGPKDESKHLIYRMQGQQGRWLSSSDLIELDPDYSEFSVRIHDPRCRSLSFINRTLAILPKSQLRTIHNLIGDYLEEVDSASKET